MSATPPEANTEYSRGSRAPRRDLAGRSGDPARDGHRSRAVPVRRFILAAGGLGAALLLVAEFTTVYTVHVAGRTVTALSSEATGTHHSYALVPIALLAALLAVGGRRVGSRPAFLATGALGALALTIALLGDLPDAHAHGVTHSFVLANATPGLGLYLETLGAILLILSGGLGLALPAGHRPSPTGRSDSDRPET